jgi:hypothetical protein
VADGGMRVWHFNGVITTYGKRDCRNSWRYASLAVNRGAIKQDFTVFIIHNINNLSQTFTMNCVNLSFAYILSIEERKVVMKK